MAVELNFKRADNSVPWGFRLTGGVDLNLPLTVVKVNENSIAEDAGMKVGDLLVRVEDVPTAGLTHLQAHDLLKEAGNIFVAAVIRGELPKHISKTEQTIDSETSHAGVSQSLQINIKANVVDTTEIIVETGDIIQQNIKINGAVVSDHEEKTVDLTVNREEKLSEEITIEKSSQQTKSEIIERQTQEMDVLRSEIDKLLEPPECIKKSEELKVLNEEKSETTAEKINKEKKWTTFLQKPDRPKPKIIQKEEEEQVKTVDNNENYYEEHVLLTRLLSLVQEPPYRVVIQKQKKKRDAERSLENSQNTTPVPIEMTVETPEVEPEQNTEEKKEEDENEVNKDNDVQEEMFEENTEPVVSEIELSLEEQLGAIQRQLLALSQLPAAIQQTLDVVTQQLTKIVGPVNDPNTEENETDEYQDDTVEETEKDAEEKTTELETLEEVSESGFDKDSQQDQEELEREENEDRPESELEMLQATPEPEEELTPEEREVRRLDQEKTDKKQKENPILSDLRHRRTPTPLTPLTRPICLPGGRRWHAPEDAQPVTRHADMSDELIAETISAQTEVLVGTTLGDSNTHLVPSKAIESKKINFLKYQPPPKTLEHLKHSEVYRLVHGMDQPLKGVGARAGKALAEEDYYAQVRTSNQEVQIKG